MTKIFPTSIRTYMNTATSLVSLTGMCTGVKHSDAEEMIEVPDLSLFSFWGCLDVYCGTLLLLHPKQTANCCQPVFLCYQFKPDKRLVGHRTPYKASTLLISKLGKIIQYCNNW